MFAVGSKVFVDDDQYTPLEVKCHLRNGNIVVESDSGELFILPASRFSQWKDHIYFDGDFEINCDFKENDKLSIEATEDYKLLIAIYDDGCVSKLHIDKEKSIKLRDWLNEFLIH